MISSFLGIKPILKISGLSAISTVFRAASTLISSKVIAMYAGPAGIALLSQLSNLVSIVTPLSTMGMNTGVVALSSKVKNKKADLESLIDTSSKIICICTLSVSLSLIVFAAPLNEYFFNRPDYKFIILLLAFTTAGNAFNNYMLSLLNGLGHYKMFVLLNISASILSLLLTVVLTIIWDVKGALVGYILSQGSMYFVTWAKIRQFDWWRFRPLTGNRFDRSIFKALSGFTLMTLANFAVVPFVQILIRNKITFLVGIEEAGLWDAVNRLSSTYLMLITSSIAVYYLPKISSLTVRSEIVREVFDTYKILLPAVLIIMFLIYGLREQVILICLTDDFLVIEDILWVQLLGDFFKIGAFLMAYALMGQGKVTTFVVVELLACLSFFLITNYLLSSFGAQLKLLVMAHAINYFLYWVIHAIIFFYGRPRAS